MTPTRRIDDANKPALTQGARAVGGTKGVKPAGEIAAAAQVAETRAAVSVDVSVTTQVRSDIQRIDGDRLALLKAQVKNGTYTVDPNALAARIAEEALDPTALE